MDTEEHQIYSDKISIGVVQLNYINNATVKDNENNLVFWAKLINAETWEEFRSLAEGNSIIEEVGNLMLQMNANDQKREILEAQRRYREQYASQYTAGYTDAEEKYVPIIEEKDAAIAEKDASLAQKDATIAEKDASLAKEMSTIERLKAQLLENGITPDLPGEP